MPSNNTELANSGRSESGHPSRPQITTSPLPPPPRLRMPRPRLWQVAVALTAVVGLSWTALFGLSSNPPRSGAPDVPSQTATSTSPPNGPCTVTTSAATVLPPVRAGDVACLTGSTQTTLTITAGGTVDRPVIYSGGGSTTVQGIEVAANNVVIEGFISVHGPAMGAQLQGSNITFQGNVISRPVYTGDDTDGLRFFGDNIKILRNTISDISDGSHCTNDGCGDGPHPDCFQTFYSDDHPVTSSNIVIDGNRCEKAAAQCLMAEGPMLPGEGVTGPGQSANWTFNNNYCDDGANQALMIKDIKNMTISNNDFEGTNHKAIALAAGSTGAHVIGNKVNPRIGELITFDDDQESNGYVGPLPADD